MRRLALVPLLLAWPCLALAGPPPDPDWPQWRGPTRDGRWPQPGLHRLPEKSPAPRWKKPIGGGYGGLAVTGGRVYVMDRQKGPKEAERVVCLDAADGKQWWAHSYPVRYGKLDYGNGPRATPTVHRGRVYAFGALGHLHCLDARTGKVVWQIDTVRDLGGKVPTWGHACSPLIDGNRLIVQVGGAKGANGANGANGALVALALDTGKVVWRAIDDEPGYASAVVIDAGKWRQLVYFSPGQVVGLEPATGKLLWSVPFEGIQYGVSISDVVFADGTLLASNYWSGSKGIRLDESGKSPQVAWEGKQLSLLMSTPLVRGKFVYALDRFRGLKCVEARTGKVLWENQHVTPRGRNPHASLVWLADGKALVFNTPGELQLVELSPAGLKSLGKVSVSGETWAHPAFAERCVFARTDAEVVCVPLLPPPAGGPSAGGAGK